MSAAGPLPNPGTPRHAVLVRVTHWTTVAAFFALLITGAEIVISHPRFYWGEVGNVMTHPLFTLPIPSLPRIADTRGGGESTRHSIRDSATSGIPVQGKYFVTVPYIFHMNDISSIALEGYNRKES